MSDHVATVILVMLGCTPPFASFARASRVYFPGCFGVSGLNPLISNRRTALGATGTEAPVLSTYLEFRNIDAFPAEKPGIDGPGARSDHRHSGAEGRQHDGDPWITGMREIPREGDRHFDDSCQRSATGVHKPTRRNIPVPTPMICRTAVGNGGASHRLAIPKWITTAPVSSRKSRSPVPGQPSAKPENSRCTILPFTA